MQATLLLLLLLSDYGIHWRRLQLQCGALNDLKASPRNGLLEFYASMPATDSTIVLDNVSFSTDSSNVTVRNFFVRLVFM
ncbi:hypothetical protein EDB86DRAFT_557657 [Lactarius hatsudake]|nr:hypothetical protein EDB86DRAFT_557657 [Lactarius hatsudake]